MTLAEMVERWQVAVGQIPDGRGGIDDRPMQQSVAVSSKVTTRNVTKSRADGSIPKRRKQAKLTSFSAGIRSAPALTGPEHMIRKKGETQSVLCVIRASIYPMV